MGNKSRILSLLICIGVIVTRTVVNGVFNNVTYNVHVGFTVNTVDDTTQTRTTRECAALCAEKFGINCKSATFHRGTKKCLLSTKGESDITYITNPSYKTVTLPSEPSEPNYIGREFYTGFMNNVNTSSLTFWFVSSVPTSVRVFIPYLSIDETLAVDGGLAQAYSATLMNTVDGEISNKGIYIYSDEPIQVFKRNKCNNSEDATIVLPLDGLGKKYLAQGSPNPGTGFSNMLLITSPRDGTEVKVNVNGTVATYILNRMETLYRYTDDVTGASVTSSSSVSVQSGNMCTFIPTNEGDCDNIGETLAPEESFGTMFSVMYMYPRSDYTVGIIAKSADTEVRIWDHNPSVLETILMNRGEVQYRQIIGQKHISVSSNAGILVTQYDHADDGSAVYGGPSMMIIPPWNSFGNMYDVYIPSDELLTVVAIMIDHEAHILFNGTVLANKERKESFSNPAGSVKAVYVYPTPGPLRITHLYAVPFAVFVYGGHESAEFAYSAGWLK